MKNASDESKAIAGMRLAYWAAFCMIGIMAIGSYLLLSQASEQQQQTSVMLGLAKSQESRSQRIIVFSHEAATAENEFKQALSVNQLRSQIEQFDAGHRQLLEWIKQNPSTDGSIETLFFAAPYDINFHTTRLLARANQFVSDFSATQDGRLIAPIAQSQASAIFSGFDALTEQLTAVSQYNMQRIRHLQSLIFAVVISLICAVALFVFNPIITHVSEKTRALAAASTQLTRLTTRDQLTDLHNRQGLSSSFNHILKQAKSDGKGVAVLQLDLDKFKAINDSYGSKVGDEVLKNVARRIKSCVRSSDIVARTGGNEFVIVLDGINDMAAIERIADTLVAKVQAPTSAGGRDFSPGISIGVSRFPNDAEISDRLLMSADLALYNAKEKGRGQVSFFNQSLMERHREKMASDDLLRSAIEDGKISFSFSPRLDLKHGEITQIDASILWVRNDGLALTNPQILDSVRDRALNKKALGLLFDSISKSLIEWKAEQVFDGTVVVDVSVGFFKCGDLADLIGEKIIKAGIESHQLCIGVPSAAFEGEKASDAARMMETLKALGIEVEISTFRFGDVDFEELAQFGVSRTRISYAYHNEAMKTAHYHGTIHSNAQNAILHGFTLVGSHVENEADIVTAIDHECSIVSGSGIALPMPPRAMTDWLKLNVRSKTITFNKVSA